MEGLIRFGKCVECESEERLLLSRNSEHRCMEDVAQPIGGLEGVLSQRFLTAYELSQDMVYLEYLDLADLACERKEIVASSLCLALFLT